MARSEIKVTKDGDKHVVSDAHSGMPLAHIVKPWSYTRDVNIVPHPLAVKHFPALGPEHSYYGVGHKFKNNERGYGGFKNKGEAENHIAWEHSARGHTDYKNKVDIKRTPEEPNEKRGSTYHIRFPKKYDFHDHETGEHIGSVEKSHEDKYEDGSVRDTHYKVKVNPEYLNKHNISDDVLHTKTGLLGRDKHQTTTKGGEDHMKEMHERFEKIPDLKGKTAILSGDIQNKDGTHKIFKINGSHSDGSSRYEKHLNDNGFTVSRTSPTTFTAHKPGKSEYDSEHFVSSHVHDGKLHVMQTTHANRNYRHNDNRKNDEIFEQKNIDDILILIEEASPTKPNKYNYIAALAKIIGR